MNPEILRTLEILNSKIAELESLRDGLAAQFGIDLRPGRPNERQKGPRAVITTRDGEPTRKQSLAAMIRQSGPMTRAELVKLNMMPDGTLGYCLRDKSIFVQLADGRWDVVDKQTTLPMPEAV